ncbi:MAG: 1-acyl-sn-glycerol-3-phosphate acyltransferase [Pyrinomonadaceae bacterium]|nr:1-acyl-sn-glycerol-3-phosphate acyltransferase [Phycisphaerales bacterium]
MTTPQPPSHPPMSPGFYRAGRLACNFIKFQCIREMVLHRERADRPVGTGLLLACTHISHLEPIVIASVLHRHIRWMARLEFYKYKWGARVLYKGGAFPVDRFGFALPAVRRGIQLVREGEIVGVFPEGGVATGRNSLLRGGPMKQGVCTMSLRTGAPIVPVVVLGTEKLNRVNPWIPPRRARLYIAFGHEIAPPVHRTEGPSANRAQRHAMAQRLRFEFQRTYHELLTHAGLTDSDVP